MSATHGIRKIKGRWPLAVGSERTAGGNLAVSVRFDPETFEQIRARAERERTSFGEQVRVLVEVGLEEMDA